MSLKFPISERFTSLQGEGRNVGGAEYFIRIAGCNLAVAHGGCRYCDTKYAQQADVVAVVSMTLEDILRDIPREYPGRVCVTGGEPLWHEGINELLERICDLGPLVMVETNGSIPIPEIPRVYFSMDIKCPGSGMDTYNNFENIYRLGWKDQLKFVISDRSDYDYAKEVLKTWHRHRAPVFFQPAYHSLESRVLAVWILEDKLNVRLSLQQQKILWGERRGV